MTLTLHHGSFRSPMRFQFKHASAHRKATQNIIVKLTSKNNIMGYGEGCPREYVTGETDATAARFTTDYGAQIVHEANTIASLRDWIASHEQLIDENPSAFCAIEVAMIDLLARQQQLTIEQYLQLPPLPKKISYTAVIGDSSAAKMRWLLLAYRLYGFATFKVKLSGNATRDQARLTTLPKGAEFRLDANNYWQQADACIDYCNKLPQKMWALEEPVQAFDYNAMAKIAAKLNIKIVLDESMYEYKHIKAVPEPHSNFVANIRVSKCGGILRSIDLANRCIDAGISVILGAHVGETSILTRASLTVGQGLKKQPLAREGAYGKLLLKRDIASRDIKFGRQGILLPYNNQFINQPGLGLDINSDTVTWNQKS